MRVKCLTVLTATIVCCGINAKDDARDPKVVVDRAIAALGGRAKLAGLEKHYKKAKKKLPDMEVLWEAWTEYPDRNKQVISFVDDLGRKMHIAVIVNGQRGWKTLVDVEEDKADTVELSDEEINKDDSYSHRGLVCRLYPLLEDDQVRLTFEGVNKDEKRSLNHVKVVTRRGSVLNLFFDMSTHLLAKCSARLSGGPHSGKMMETSFSDYKNFDGVKYATQVSVRIGGEIFAQEQVIDLRVIKNFPADTFSMP